MNLRSLMNVGMFLCPGIGIVLYNGAVDTAKDFRYDLVVPGVLVPLNVLIVYRKNFGHGFGKPVADFLTSC